MKEVVAPQNLRFAHSSLKDAYSLGDTPPKQHSVLSRVARRSHYNTFCGATTSFTCPRPNRRFLGRTSSEGLRHRTTVAFCTSSSSYLSRDSNPRFAAPICWVPILQNLRPFASHTPSNHAKGNIQLPPKAYAEQNL